MKIYPSCLKHVNVKHKHCSGMTFLSHVNVEKLAIKLWNSPSVRKQNKLDRLVLWYDAGEAIGRDDKGRTTSIVRMVVGKPDKKEPQYRLITLFPVDI